MRKLIIGLPIAVAVLVAVNSVVAASPAAPDLTAWDQAREDIVDAVEIDAGSPAAVTAGGVSIPDARTFASADIDPSLPARYWKGRAAQFEGDPLRDVIVVVVSGGTYPFSGPIGSDLGARNARVTGVILDAKTGEFLRGFMLD